MGKGSGELLGGFGHNLGEVDTNYPTVQNGLNLLTTVILEDDVLLLNVILFQQSLPHNLPQLDY